MRGGCWSVQDASRPWRHRLAKPLRHCEERSDAAIQAVPLDCFAMLARTEMMMDSLVSTEWLTAQLGASDLRILDCSWHMPVDGRDAAAEFEQVHIPGARFLDIEHVADTSSALP